MLVGKMSLNSSQVLAAYMICYFCWRCSRSCRVFVCSLLLLSGLHL